jgi:hypothetical protein
LGILTGPALIRLVLQVRPHHFPMPKAKWQCQRASCKMSNNPDVDFKALLARKKRWIDSTKFCGVGLEKPRIVTASGITKALQFIKLCQVHKGDGETPVQILALFKNMPLARKPDVLLGGWIPTLQTEIQFSDNKAQAVWAEISRI